MPVWYSSFCALSLSQVRIMEMKGKSMIVHDSNSLDAWIDLHEINRCFTSLCRLIVVWIYVWWISCNHHSYRCIRLTPTEAQLSMHAHQPNTGRKNWCCYFHVLVLCCIVAWPYSGSPKFCSSRTLQHINIIRWFFARTSIDTLSVDGRNERFSIAKGGCWLTFLWWIIIICWSPKFRSSRTRQILLQSMIIAQCCHLIVDFGADTRYPLHPWIRLSIPNDISRYNHFYLPPLCSCDAWL